jgi:putative membrane protein
MTYRLWYIITWPSAIKRFAYWCFYWPSLATNALDACKTLYLFALYHGKCQQIFNQLQNDQIKYTTNFMRLWNECYYHSLR